MTNHPVHDSGDQASDRWLVQRRHALVVALDEVLDREAGLREVLMASRRSAAVDSLATALDLEGGLADILSTAPRSNPAATAATASDASGAQALLHTVRAADRIVLRSRLDIRTASHGLERALHLSSKLDTSRGTSRFPDSDVHPLVVKHARRLARELAILLCRDLTAAAGHAGCPDLARTLARALTHALGLTRGLGHGLIRMEAEALAQDIDNADSLCRVLERGNPRDPSQARARARAHDLWRLLKHILDLLGKPHDPPFARELGDTRLVIVDIRVKEVCRMIGLAMECAPPVFDLKSLHMFLDDFTRADLRDAVLTGIDLGGIHWSQYATRWPPTVDVDGLKTHSQQAPPGSGIWIVRSGTATVHDLAEL